MTLVSASEDTETEKNCSRSLHLLKVNECSSTDQTFILLSSSRASLKNFTYHCVAKGVSSDDNPNTTLNISQSK